MMARKPLAVGNLVHSCGSLARRSFVSMSLPRTHALAIQYIPASSTSQHRPLFSCSVFAPRFFFPRMFTSLPFPSPLPHV